MILTLESYTASPAFLRFLIHFFSEIDVDNNELQVALSLC